MSIFRKIRTAIRTFSTGGFRGVQRKLIQKRREAIEKRRYRLWLKKFGSLDSHACDVLRERITKFDRKPIISIILPVYNVDEKWLRLCLDSVLNQVYENWELCIADDHSPSPHIRTILDEYRTKDARIHVVYRPENGHISAASNSALEIASGEFSVLLDHDDEMSRDALFWLAAEINQFPQTAMIYSDEDMIDEHGMRFDPKFKPDFSRDLLYSQNLVTHLSAYKTQILRDIGGFRPGYEGSQDYDLALRFIEQIREDQIRHIPRVLYHWRAIPGSVALSGDEKPYAHERARTAIRDHFRRTGVAVTVEATHFNVHRVIYELPPDRPRVLLISHGAAESEDGNIEKLLAETNYQNVEVVIIKSGENLAADLNAAACKSTATILCFTGADLTPTSAGWLDQMIGFAIQPEIGAVGGKTISSDGFVAGGAIVLGGERLANQAHDGLFAGELGNYRRNMLTGNFSAVSISCLAVRRTLFDEVGGLDAEHLPCTLIDADFCLKLLEKGYRNVFVPYAEMISDRKLKSNRRERLTETERDFFKRRWKTYLDHDPFSNPNLLKMTEV